MYMLKTVFALSLLCLSHWVFSVESGDSETQRVTPSAIEVRYPIVPEDPAYSIRSDYFREVLNLALSKSGSAFQLTAVPVKPFPSSRTVLMMAEGHFDVSWVHTSPEREHKMRAIRYPIYRGLVGWRLLIVRKGSENMFAEVANLSSLQKFVAGQGHDWPDVPILRHNGLTVREGVSRNSVFRQLTRSRVDYFPRGVNEIWDEMGLEAASGTVIENHLVMHYPTAFYLFVNKSNETLAQLLETGFEKALDDGSFKSLFMSYMGDTIARARLAERTIIELKNPDLPAATPLSRDELWFHPNRVSSVANK